MEVGSGLRKLARVMGACVGVAAKTAVTQAVTSTTALVVNSCVHMYVHANREREIGGRREIEEKSNE